MRVTNKNPSRRVKREPGYESFPTAEGELWARVTTNRGRPRIRIPMIEA